ncbi:carbohydrate sulfotransferase 9 [Microcaecilia unicolor]|uniref:Carbohydrate sulfotransferase n=1 Tax=Microcaecilia unicolor TaxID=1415580 RepID=A0A6P7X8P7_9AMPH|nr:carbohydrate sulfotransferase 9-like [Microcaecilia unicolor]
MRFSSRIIIILACIGTMSLFCWWLHAGPSLPLQAPGDPLKTNFTFTVDTFLHVQQLRKKKLRSFCRSHTEFQEFLSQDNLQQVILHMMVNTKLEFVYCWVPALGMDSWEQLLHTLAESRHLTMRKPVNSISVPLSALPVNYLRDFNATSIAMILRSYTKVLFIKDPFQRLVTAYMQRFAGEITFNDFIQMILRTKSREVDVLWKPLVSLCWPCLVNYDYILKYGFLGQEVHHLMGRLGMPTDLVPEFADAQFKWTDSWLGKQLASELSSEQKKQLHKAFLWDFAAFGFPDSQLQN